MEKCFWKNKIFIYCQSVRGNEYYYVLLGKSVLVVQWNDGDDDGGDKFLQEEELRNYLQI
jgi:hypothetical protein